MASKKSFPFGTDGNPLGGVPLSDAVKESAQQIWLAGLGAAPSGLRHAQVVEDTLDALADHMERHLDVSGLLDAATPVSR